ncbi:MAG: hypothetical protein K0Q59_4755 [Paenibacillus sp.]|nr:hypothetical protein [Paenibacillus sp.]
MPELPVPLPSLRVAAIDRPFISIPFDPVMYTIKQLCHFVTEQIIHKLAQIVPVL